VSGSLIAIAAGGTGGHFFPAEALAAELKRRGHGVALLTDARSSGETSTVFADCPRFVLKGSGIAGRGLMGKAKSALALAAGTVQARTILRRLRPAALVGFGGYPSVAPVLAARTISPRPRIILHEQNAVLGRANRALARFADALALSFPETKLLPAFTPSLLTGNPVRPAIAALAGRGYSVADDKFRLLVLGGSQGARVFSTLIPEALSHLPRDIWERLTLVQQCRAEDIEHVRAIYAELGVDAELAPFFPEIAERLAAAHLVIARAGASTVAELAAIGRPSILIPLPGAIDDHQRENAMALAEAGGAWMMHQSAIFAADLAEFLLPLLGRPRDLAPLAAAAASFGRLDAALRLADLVEHSIQIKDAE
jgi:UDP-N-acetylglucosamine--N-acetylmuramyl-(pentapeptide) pyrophosphoryl-undecaprenol N-acetylglucosamine transferase